MDKNLAVVDVLVQTSEAEFQPDAALFADMPTVAISFGTADVCFV